jgi:glycosyltransferase involved in cell wall biosynthesis
METMLQQGRLAPLKLAPLDEQPLVSILVANYNYERYIGEALDSALRQTYGNFELVVCDDGSTDGSMRVIESYASRDSRIRFARKPNGGHGSALNKAFDLCHGNIICLLDSDDLFLPEKVERVVCLFRREEQAGIVIHRVIHVNENRESQGVWPLYGGLPEGWRGEELLESGGVLPYLPPTSGLSFRREVAEHVFPLPVNPPVGNCPDQVLMRLAPMISTLAKLDEPLAEYRIHSANTYTRSGLTQGTVSREIALGEKLWAAQRDFLRHAAPDSASRLRPVEESQYFLLLKYLEARLRGGAVRKERFAAFITSLRRQGSRKQLAFWQMTERMPHPLFAFIVNLLMGPSAFKQALVRLGRLNRRRG